MKFENTNWFDRRKHVRFQVKGKVFAFILSEETRLGPVYDISNGGFSFYYVKGMMSDDIDIDVLSKKSFELSISSEDGESCLEKLKVKIISNTEAKSGASSNNFIPLRRCGVQFEKLNDLQESRIQEFIQLHARI